PCAFLAIDYMLLSRLAATFDQDVANRCLLIRPSRIVRIFVWSDVATFVLQAGGALAASTNTVLPNIGQRLPIVGLCLQLVSFVFFTITSIIFGWRLCSHEYPTLKDAPRNGKMFQRARILSREPIYDWRILYSILCVSAVAILIRSVFRITEYAGGF
ncbi:RTA-like protein, partial [Mycena rebaudengoi]